MSYITMDCIRSVMRIDSDPVQEEPLSDPETEARHPESAAAAVNLQAVEMGVLRAARKVIAVHVSYSARAAQRGSAPEKPSYFLKAASSLSLTDGTVERPAGTELLGFEGEIALVVGEPARRVSMEQAWSHIAAVTAANDLGVYDLKHADKGSNVRSKSGDGFTPLGPRLIPAAEVDPAGLRIRTWLNSALVQVDDTSTLIFPFAQLVADLSQLMTLETGDVILTGTPVGASVLKPGDVVEVCVDAPELGLSTGKLRTTAVQGSEEFADFGALPHVNDADRIAAYGSAEAAGLPPEVPALTRELKAKLEQVSTATLSSALRKRGLNNVSIDGLHGTKPGAKVVGLARTLRFVPNREDLFATHGGGFNAQKRAIDTVNEGEVLVMEARGEGGTGTLGDIMAMRAQVRGAAGIVTDGGIRDFDAVAAMDIPTFGKNAHPAVLGRRHIPWDTDITIACGGTTVQPGDVIVADGDGILVIPPALVEELVTECLETERSEEFVLEMVKAGHSVDGLHPMNAQWKAQYALWTPGEHAGTGQDQ